MENELIVKWIEDTNKDIGKLTKILKQLKKLDNSELKADLENRIVDWVLIRTRAIKEMEGLRFTGENGN